MSVSRDPDADTQLARVATLHEPIRRMLYRFVADQHGPVSRDQAAEGLGIARHIAKFHLDRLAADGLLDIDYRRPAGRTGPGAGRPTKLYRRADQEITVSIPDRHYDLAAEIMADAITAARDTGIPIDAALRTAARRAGAELGASAPAVTDLLDAIGYEPDTVTDATAVTLRNCPFHRLLTRHRDLVCGMNLDLLTGLLDRHPAAGLTARLDPGPDRCCVTLVRTAAR